MRYLLHSPARGAIEGARALTRISFRRLYPEAALVLLFFFFLLFAGTLFAFSALSDYGQSLNRARDTTQGAALLLDDNVRRTVETSDVLVHQVNALIADKGVEALRESRTLWGRLWNLARAMRNSGSIWVFDENGTPILTSRAFGIPNASFTTLDGTPYRPKLGSQGRDRRVTIGPPIVERTSGRLLLPLSWRLSTTDFTGTTVSALAIESFTDIYAKPSSWIQSTLTVLNENGDILLRQPVGRKEIGKNLRDSALFAVHLPQSTVGTFESVSPVDGRRSIVSYRKVSGLPIVVTASIPYDNALAGWRSRFRWDGLVAITGLAAAAMLLWPTVRMMRRNEAALEALREAHHRNVEILESISDAFFALDDNWNFTYVNSAAEAISGGKRETLIGRNIWTRFPQLIDSDTYHHLLRAAKRRERVTFETFSSVLQTWVEIRIYPSRTGLSVYFRDISARKRAERQQRMLLAELSHRVKNTLAVVLSIASQTLRRSTSLEDFGASFRGRIMALAKAHSLLTASRWEEARIGDLVAQALRPYARNGETKYRAEGPEINLQPKAALALALVLHELATNAAKYGALSNAAGRIDILWRRQGRAEGERIHLVWHEYGGPSTTPPNHKGFGIDLIERSIAYELGGEVQLAFHEGGLHCEIAFPPRKNTALAEIADDS